MTATELNRETANGSANGIDYSGTEALGEQVVLSGAGLVSRGIGLTRVNTEAFVGVLDEIFLGTLDVVEEWAKMSGQMAEQFSTKPIEVVRRAYTTGTSSLRHLVAAI